MMSTIKSAEPNAGKSAVSRKLMLLLLSIVLLIVVAVYAATAWYTRMVQVADMTFTTAQWEFLANEAMDAISLNVYEYSTIQSNEGGNVQDPAAPGTAGYIPVYLSAEEAESDVDYIVTIDETSMSEAFQDRIVFYYYDANGAEAGGNDGTSETGALLSSVTDFVAHSANLVEFTDVNYIEGTIDISEEDGVIIYIYWEWVYELTPADMAEYTDGENDASLTNANDLYTDENLIQTYRGEDGALVEGVTLSDSSGNTYDADDADFEEKVQIVEAKIQAIVTENNEFDTKVGKNPTLYEDDMIATVNIAGVEAYPEAETTT